MKEIKYLLIWENEEIDSADSLEEAKFLAKEYQMAYGGAIVTIKKQTKKH